MENNMHAGDALWGLYGFAAWLRYNSPNGPALDYVEQLLTTLSTHVQVQPPDTPALSAIVSTFDAFKSARTEQPGNTGRGNSQYSDPERVEAAKTLATQMTDSDLFSWAEIVASISDQLDTKSFITDKQLNALVNVARRGEYDDGLTFWEQFEDDYPEAAGYILARIRSA